MRHIVAAYIKVSFDSLILHRSVRTLYQVLMQSDHTLHVLNPLMHIFARALLCLLCHFPVLPLHFIGLQHIFAVLHLHVLLVTFWYLMQICEESLEFAISLKQLLKPLELHPDLLIILKSLRGRDYCHMNLTYILVSKSIFS